MRRARVDLGGWVPSLARLRLAGLAGALVALYPPLLPLLAPGLLLWRRPPRALADDPLRLAALVPIASVAFWAVAVHGLRWAPFSLGGLALAVGGATLVGLCALAPRPLPALDRASRRAAILVGAAALLRLSPLLFLRAPAGADMSMHAALARLLADADGWPSSQRPYLPVDNFGSYPLGFHVQVALGLRLGGDVLRTPLFWACAVQGLAVPALFAALRRLGLGAWPAAAGAAIGLFCCSLPQTALSWGGAPTVLGYVLLFGAVALVPRPASGGHPGPGAPALLALVAAGAASAHLIPVAAGVYGLLPAAIGLAVATRRQPGARAALLATGAAALGALVLAAPYLFGGFVDVSPFEKQWVRDLIGAEHGSVLRSPLLFNSVGPVVPLLAAIGLGAGARERPALAVAALLAVLGVGLCFLATYGFWLPQAELLYPSRLGTLLHLPLGLGVGWAIERLAGRRAAALALAAALGAFGLFMHVHEYQMGAADDVTVTADDRAALDWMGESLPPGALVANNYGDAGLWIPAVARRAITRIHSNPFFFSEILEAGRNQRADWVFVGAKWTYPKRARPWRHPDVDRDPRLVRVFARGQAAVYRVVGEPIAVAPLLPPAASAADAP